MLRMSGDPAAPSSYGFSLPTDWSQFCFATPVWGRLRAETSGLCARTLLVSSSPSTTAHAKQVRPWWLSERIVLPAQSFHVVNTFSHPFPLAPPARLLKPSALALSGLGQPLSSTLHKGGSSTSLLAFYPLLQRIFRGKVHLQVYVTATQFKNVRVKRDAIFTLVPCDDSVIEALGKPEGTLAHASWLPQDHIRTKALTTTYA